MESLDDNKKVTSTVRFLANGKTNNNTNVKHTNGHNNLENSEMSMVPSFESASTSLISEFQLPKLSFQQQQKQQQQPQYEPTKTDFTFTDHKRYSKNFHEDHHIKIDDLLSSQSDILSNVRSRSESRSILEKSPVFPVLSMPKKAYSVGAMNHSDPEYLMEALETLADTQPRVARSIPKHAIIDTSNFVARSLDNCLFDATVYDAMLHDSLKVCEMLQNHLNQCIVTARTNCSNGFLEVLTEESEENMETTCNKNELDNITYHSTTNNNILVSSNNNNNETLNITVKPNE
ncbi:Uncharacterized protein BM_BM3087 [Brugia malayi]|uniref:Uncharacterized protein n=1 Tax=Brugia malayi TaxID=6279 RepID=A0A4E9EXA6_BRUMA|nr:Uncharacterized protein BM_BM3087 [Brugia malayi]VIO88163.1 Uncharacterized protein BM_BM3087 [Brugia malayi]